MHFGTGVHTGTLHAHRLFEKLHTGALHEYKQISTLQTLYWQYKESNMHTDGPTQVGTHSLEHTARKH